jgi:hypothetical protein
MAKKSDIFSYWQSDVAKDWLSLTRSAKRGKR